MKTMQERIQMEREKQTSRLQEILYPERDPVPQAQPERRKPGAGVPTRKSGEGQGMFKSQTEQNA